MEGGRGPLRSWQGDAGLGGAQSEGRALGVRERDSSRSSPHHTHTSPGVALFLRNRSREWRVKDFHSLPGGARASRLGLHRPVW